MAETCDLQVHINGRQTFFVNEKIISRFSGKLRKMIKQEKRRTQIRNSGIDINDFPGGPEGFELVSRFCYNNGNISISVANVSLLHCCALFLGMTEKKKTCNLLHQTEVFLEGMFYWSWGELLTCLKNSESFFSYADSCGLVQKLLFSLLAKIAQNSDMNFLASSPSSSSSPETVSGFRLSSSSAKAWWFDDMTILSPNIVEKFVKTLGGYGNENNNLVLTRFLLHYLKSTNLMYPRSDYVGIAETAIYGVIFIGKSAFSCRALFWVLRIVSGFRVSKEARTGLERLIAGVLDQASLDDLLVKRSSSGGGGGSAAGGDGGVYDVSLVLRLIRLFVHHDDHDKVVSLMKMKKVGRLIDKYLREIAPDLSLKISKFLVVAESLPDCARDCFDGVYRAIDIFLESHPTLSLEERSRLCRCLNYEKLSLEACKDLAKNPRIPPRIAVQALSSQHPIQDQNDYYYSSSSKSINNQMVVYDGNKHDNSSSSSSKGTSPQHSDEMRLKLQKMQWRVVELEKVCKEMKGQMTKMVKGGGGSRMLPRLC